MMWPWYAVAGFASGVALATVTGPAPVEPPACPAGTRVQITEPDGTTRCVLAANRAGPGDIVFERGG
jgi:hypothetical protein